MTSRTWRDCLSPLQLGQASTSDENQRRLEVVDHVDQHMSRHLGVDRLAVDSDIEASPFEQGSGLAREREGSRLPFALVRDLGLLRRVVSIHCAGGRTLSMMRVLGGPDQERRTLGIGFHDRHDKALRMGKKA